jgi:chaperone modulatory protein CbpM
MTDITTINAVCLGEDAWLDLAELARVCGVTSEFIETLIADDLLAPARLQPPGFGGAEIARVRRILRLQRDFEASLPSVALLLDLLDENERLRARLRRAGLDAD